MACCQLARRTRNFDVSWPEPITATSVAEGDAAAIGAFLLRVGHPLRPECETGTIAGATFYVTRLFDYHQHDQQYDLALACSTLVRTPPLDGVVAVCLVGGGGRDGGAFGIYDIMVDPAFRNLGIGRAMILRALTVLAEQGVTSLHLWVNDDAPARRLYERLGFSPTGCVE